MSEPLAERQHELIEFAESSIEHQDHFDYHNWDGFIEDGTLTEEELDWLRENFEVYVELVRK